MYPISGFVVAFFCIYYLHDRFDFDLLNKKENRIITWVVAALFGLVLDIIATIVIYNMFKDGPYDRKSVNYRNNMDRRNETEFDNMRYNQNPFGNNGRESDGDGSSDGGTYTQGYTGQNYDGTYTQGYTGQNYDRTHTQGYTGQNYDRTHTQGYTGQNYDRTHTQGYTGQNYDRTYTQGYTGTNNNYGSTSNTAGCFTGSRGAVSNPYKLPTREKTRRRIVEKFNKRFNLNLSERDIDNMVSASYMSKEWACEIHRMQDKYDSVYQWIGMSNTWLRVYLYVFNVQSIAPLMSQQESLIYDSYDIMFSDFCTDEKLPIEAVIDNINRKYLTNFDETTFRLAIGYMESRGKRYKFGSSIVTNIDEEMEDLTNKYEKMV